MQKIVLSLLLLVTSFSLAQSGYNEVFDSHGNLRKGYEAVYPYWQAKFQNQPMEQEYLKQSRKAFQGDNALDPMPRLIPPTDFEHITKGVKQRAKALRHFLQDHYSGQKRYAQSGIVAAEVIDQIIDRSGERGYEGLVRAQDIAFFYGPDIIRDETGEWRIIEDNPGYIGGIGDLPLAQKIMLKTYPELQQKLRVQPVQPFYESLAASFKQEAQKRSGIAVMYTVPSYSSDNEDQRIQNLMKQQGIPTITPNGPNQLAFRADGIYLVQPGKQNVPAQKIGYIFLNLEHAWGDPSHPAARIKNLVEAASDTLNNPKAKETLKSQLSIALQAKDITKLEELIGSEVRASIISSLYKKNRGLLNLILSGKVGCNYTPGIDFIGDKEFYVYVEDLIRFYLHEEPIIKNIPTKSFAKKDSQNQLDEHLMRSIFSKLPEYVVKKVDGRGGNAVWVGPKVSSDQIEGLKAAISENPELYIVQKYMPLSYVNDNIVDLRVITSVLPDRILVANAPWGRGLPKSGDGKVNLSSEGREVTILVAKPIEYVNGRMVRTCQEVLH